MILQFADRGNLRNYLETKWRDNIYKISWDELIKIAKQIALGLEYLHQINIIHRDLVSFNFFSFIPF